MISMLRAICWSLQYSYILISLSLPISLIDWSICTIVPILATIQGVSAMVSVTIFCEPMITKYIYITVLTMCEITFEKDIHGKLSSDIKSRNKGCSRSYEQYHNRRPPNARDKRVPRIRLKPSHRIKRQTEDEDDSLRGSESTDKYLAYNQQNKSKSRQEYRPIQTYFDKDSFLMGVDDHNPACIYNN